MPIKIRSTYETEVDVIFSDPKKAEKYFIHGDWKNSFWTYDDMDELAADIGRSVKREHCSWNAELKTWTVFAEGYGLFVQRESDVWVLSEEFQEYCGEVIVEILSDEDHMNSSGGC